MRKAFYFLCIIIGVLGCKKEDNLVGNHIASIRFVVQDQPDTKVSIARHDDYTYRLCWDDGDSVSFVVCVWPTWMGLKEVSQVNLPENLEPGIITGGALSLDDFLFYSSGKLVYEGGVWNAFVSDGTGYIQQEKIDVEIKTVIGEDTRMVFDYQFNHDGENIPLEERFSIRWVKGYPFQEGDHTIVVSLADQFANIR